MKYKAYHFTINPLEPAREILLAELGQLGFESFEDKEDGLSAYIQEDQVRDDILSDIYILNQDEFKIDYRTEDVEEQNWNAVWESSFDPIRVGDQCLVRAEFHQAEKVDYDIVITPKMSFGTGHHATTYMILKFILEDDFQDKLCLDMGCGTGVLGILALMKKAKKADFIDIDDWCIDNTKENLQKNKLSGKCILGGADQIKDSYDVIFANINRNILLNDMSTYVKHLNKGGDIYFSGFYDEDFDQIINVAADLGLEYVKHNLKDKWVAAKFKHSL
ncbi:MAG: 50S ribosomal protein L11 methyltransferase [Psychroflexus halocasei]